MPKTKELLHSSRKTPCPVCDRTKDADCSWTLDKKTVLCHTFATESAAPVANGYHFTEHYCDDGIHGADSAAIYSNEPSKTKGQGFSPNKQQRVKSRAISF